MKVGKLKDILQDVINTLEDFDDSDEVVTVSNTYYLNNSNSFFGCYEGYIDFNNLNIAENEDDEEEEE